MSTIPESTSLGQHVVIEKDVTLGENVVIGHHTTILEGTEIGDDVTIGNHCVLGIQPSSNKNMRHVTKKNLGLVIQSHTNIGHLVSIYSGTHIGNDVFVGDHASIREHVTIGEQSVIGRACIIELNTTIGKACTIQTLAYITGDSTLEDDVFIGPCVSMSNDKYMGAEAYSLGGPYLKKGAKIGNNATLLPHVTVGEHTIVGAGAVVTKSLSDHITAVGIPAKEIN